MQPTHGCARFWAILAEGNPRGPGRNRLLQNSRFTPRRGPRLKKGRLRRVKRRPRQDRREQGAGGECGRGNLRDS